MNGRGSDMFSGERNGRFYESAVTEAQVAMYLARVMGWMCVGLLTTFVAALACLVSDGFLMALYATRGLFAGIIIAELAVVLILSAAVNKLSPAAATVLFMAYAALTGVTMSVLVLMFAISSIVFVFALAAGIFLIMAVAGFATKRDLTRAGTLAAFGLFGVIAAGIANIFIGSGVLDFVVSAIGVVIFIVLTAYDTQRIKGMYIGAMESGLTDESESVRKASIYGALTLYLDFINLFFKLLRILGKRR